MRKIIRGLLSATLALTLCMPVFAEESPALSTDALHPIAVYGYIVDETESSIEVQDESDEDTRIILNLSEDTCIVDAVTGQPALLSERETDRIAAFYGPMTTRSIPPQSPVVAIAVNLPENNRSPHYAVVESITSAEDSVKVLTNGGSLYATIQRDAPIMPYLTRNIVTIDHIRVGTELMLWYDMVAMSYPGQTTSRQTVILRNPVTAHDAESALETEKESDVEIAVETVASDQILFTFNAGVASVNGSEVNLDGMRYLEDKTPMIPLRRLSEALGYEVGWNAAEQSVVLRKGTHQVSLTNQSPLYSFNGLELVLAYAPVIENGVTLVPLSFFEHLPNIQLSFNEFE